MTEAWFVYTRFLGIWRPRVVFDEKPKPRKGEEELMTVPVLVPDDCRGPDGEPMFGKLQERFPAPREAE